MKTLLFTILSLFLADTQAVNHCKRYENSENTELVIALSEKLLYEYSEFCEQERIADLQVEVRRYYYRDSDEFEDHKVLTVHYWEYSCEYHFNLVRENWQDERNYCYSTF